MFVKLRRVVLFLLFILAGTNLFAQREKVKNQPYADMKLFHLGFHVGLHAQDLILTNSGAETNGETWFAGIPSYSPGFSVGIIGDMYLNPYFNLRLTPTIHFGDKKVVFTQHPDLEQETYEYSLRSNYLSFPLDIKYTALRLNNYRPYLIGGVFGAFDLGRKKGNALLLKGMDYGLSIGFGCDIYLPFFKLCPEIRYQFGLKDLLVKDRTDLIDQDLFRYSNSLSKATSRMLVLTFNFE